MQTRRTVIRLALVFTGILFFQTIHSQEKYLPGYVINLKGDTIHGFIDYRNWKINPDKIDFKDRTENKEISYQPSDITEFKVNDEIYVSAAVNIETSPRNTEDLNYDKALNLQAKTTFLQTIYKGKKSLYYYFVQGKEYFYIRQDTSYELLVYKRYLLAQGDTTVIKENKGYWGQLNKYLQECPGIEDKLIKTAYKLPDMNNLFKFYYEGTKSEISFKKTAEGVKVETGLLAGASLTSLTFSGTSYLTQTDFNNSVNFSAALYCELILARNQRKWSINNELILSTYNVSGTYKQGVEENYTLTTTELGYTYLKLNNLVRFKYPVGRSYIFLNGGVSNGFVLKETNYKSVFTKFYSSETTVEGVAIDDSKKYELGFIIGTGLKTSRYSVEARYEIGNGMSRVLSATSKTNRIYVLLGFRF
jgi:hypothetical protein